MVAKKFFFVLKKLGAGPNTGATMMTSIRGLKEALNSNDIKKKDSVLELEDISLQNIGSRRGNNAKGAFGKNRLNNLLEIEQENKGTTNLNRFKKPLTKKQMMLGANDVQGQFNDEQESSLERTDDQSYFGSFYCKETENFQQHNMNNNLYGMIGDSQDVTMYGMEIDTCQGEDMTGMDSFELDNSKGDIIMNPHQNFHNQLNHGDEIGLQLQGEFIDNNEQNYEEEANQFSNGSENSNPLNVHQEIMEDYVIGAAQN